MKKNYLQILPAIFRDIEAELIFQRLTPSHGEKAEEKETGINKK